MSGERVAYAMAPPSVGNMAVGFDVLGHALDAPGDQIRATRVDGHEVVMGDISGCVERLPEDPRANTAGASVLALLEAQNESFGVRLDVHKGVALGSGMGGSASSAVASVVAVNALLSSPLTLSELLPFALAGEQVASGCIHGDNVAPCLFGGIVFIPPSHPERYVSIPVPDRLSCVLVRPDLRLDTSAGRSILGDSVRLADAVTQTSHLSSVLCACFNNDIDALQDVLTDVLVEPQRCHQVKGFATIKDAALSSGALGFSLSGSGPSMVAWMRQEDQASVETRIRGEMETIYGSDYQCVTSAVNARGARLISSEEWLGG